ncbi:MAG TPA: hypothetical protein DIV86_05805 [Alphaproteobacteria bacterium]|nr:hypothetical protein [Alphaproteobacteria bacterium]
MKNIIIKFLKGDIKLVITFWFSFVVSKLLNTALDLTATEDVKINLLIFILALIIQICLWVATWRSASNYKGYKGWSRGAKLITVLGVIFSIIEFLALIRNFFN